MMDYDNMPAGEEMDVEVARIVFGQTDFSHLETVYEEGNTPDGRDGWSGFVCPRCRTPVDMLNHPCVQHYSTSISDAFKIVEMIGLCVDYQTNTVIVSKNGIEMARAFNNASLAICRAALKVRSPKVD